MPQKTTIYTRLEHKLPRAKTPSEFKCANKMFNNMIIARLWLNGMDEVH